jgi:hypothetical protein
MSSWNLSDWIFWVIIGFLIALASSVVLIIWQVSLIETFVVLPQKAGWLDRAEALGAASGFASLVFGIFGFLIVLATFVWQCNESIKSQEESQKIMSKLNTAVENLTNMSESSRLETRIEAITAAINAINSRLSAFQTDSQPESIQNLCYKLEGQRDSLVDQLIDLCEKYATPTSSSPPETTPNIGAN